MSKSYGCLHPGAHLRRVPLSELSSRQEQESSYLLFLTAGTMTSVFNFFFFCSSLSPCAGLARRVFCHYSTTPQTSGLPADTPRQFQCVHLGASLGPPFLPRSFIQKVQDPVAPHVQSLCPHAYICGCTRMWRYACSRKSDPSLLLFFLIDHRSYASSVTRFLSCFPFLSFKPV